MACLTTAFTIPRKHSANARAQNLSWYTEYVSKNKYSIWRKADFVITRFSIVKYVEYICICETQKNVNF